MTCELFAFAGDRSLADVPTFAKTNPTDRPMLWKPQTKKKSISTSPARVLTLALPTGMTAEPGKQTVKA